MGAKSLADSRFQINNDSPQVGYKHVWDLNERFQYSCWQATPYAVWLVFAGLLGAQLTALPRPAGVAVLIALIAFALIVYLRFYSLAGL